MTRKKKPTSAARKKTKKPARAPRSSEAAGGADLATLTENIRSEIWPTEKAVLFRPERMQYVRKLVKPQGCVFCAALAKGPSPESLLLYSGKEAIVVMNKFPYNSGHLLVLPRRHFGEFQGITDEEHAAMNRCLRRAVDALTDAYSPSGFNIGLNLGSASGAGIPEHLHYHVVPRWSGDTNFFPLIAGTKVVVETLEQTYMRLLPYFEAFA